MHAMDIEDEKTAKQNSKISKKSVRKYRHKIKKMFARSNSKSKTSKKWVKKSLTKKRKIRDFVDQNYNIDSINLKNESFENIIEDFQPEKTSNSIMKPKYEKSIKNRKMSKAAEEEELNSEQSVMGKTVRFKDLDLKHNDLEFEEPV
jgi:hypothetical protein